MLIKAWGLIVYMDQSLLMGRNFRVDPFLYNCILNVVCPSCPASWVWEEARPLSRPAQCLDWTSASMGSGKLQECNLPSSRHLLPKTSWTRLHKVTKAAIFPKEHFTYLNIKLLIVMWITDKWSHQWRRERGKEERWRLKGTKRREGGTVFETLLKLRQWSKLNQLETNTKQNPLQTNKQNNTK